MSDNRTELEKRNVLRLSNEESHRLTQECIQTAFISLLAEKEMDKITISEIVKKSGVSRSALYRNYESKEAILEAISNELLNDINRLGWKAITEEDPHIIYQNVFSRVREEEKLFSLVVRAGLMDKDALHIRDFIVKQYAGFDRRIRHILLGWSGMLKDIILSWYLEGMEEDVAAMSDLCCALSESIVDQITFIDPEFSNKAVSGAKSEVSSQ